MIVCNMISILKFVRKKKIKIVMLFLKTALPRWKTLPYSALLSFSNLKWGIKNRSNEQHQ